MKLIDTNALIILIIGLINPKLIQSHSRTSIYEEEDFYILLSKIEDMNTLVVLPNVWTEVDNLLNGFNRGYKDKYISQIRATIQNTNEKYLQSTIAAQSGGFYDLGLTDSLLLEFAKQCELLITSDSKLSDYALSNGTKVFDMVKYRNNRF